VKHDFTVKTAFLIVRYYVEQLTIANMFTCKLCTHLHIYIHTTHASSQQIVQ